MNQIPEISSDWAFEPRLQEMKSCLAWRLHFDVTKGMRPVRKQDISWICPLTSRLFSPGKKQGAGLPGAGALCLWRSELHFLLQADGNSEHSKRKLPMSSPKRQAMLKVGGKENRNSSNSLWIICSSLTLQC